MHLHNSIMVAADTSDLVLVTEDDMFRDALRANLQATVVSWIHLSIYEKKKQLDDRPEQMRIYSRPSRDHFMAKNLFCTQALQKCNAQLGSK